MRLLDSLSLFFRKLRRRSQSFGHDENNDLTPSANVRKGPRRNYASNTPVLKRIGKNGDRAPIPSDLLEMDPIIPAPSKLQSSFVTQPMLEGKPMAFEVVPPTVAHLDESVTLHKAVKRCGTVRFSSEPPVVEHLAVCSQPPPRTASLHPELCCGSGFESISIPPHLCNVVAACEAHFASRDDEIRVKEDDPIGVQRIFPDGWSEGMNWRTGLCGTFPLHCIDPIECERVISEYESLVVAIMAEAEKLATNDFIEDMGPRTRSQRSFANPKEYTTVPKRQRYTTLGAVMMKSPSCSWTANRGFGGCEPARFASSEPYVRTYSRRMGLPLCGGEDGSIPRITTRIIIPHPDMLHFEMEPSQETVVLAIKQTCDKHEEAAASIASDPNRTWASAEVPTLQVRGPTSPATETESALLSGTPSFETDLSEVDNAVHLAEIEPEVRSGSVTPKNPVLEIVGPFNDNDENGDMPLSEYLRAVMPRSRSASVASF
ncbi:hypothetical protein BJ742DRAFT_773677 [Cladochytrium replicatum]|nr:hypothetical protein BJ742DRAFT_773677 [Cladochytrium replicatum]